MSFEDIKVGDTIVVSTYSRDYIDKVIRVTKTLFITNHYRFNKKDGYIFGGGSYARVRAKKCSEKEIRKVEMSMRRDNLYQSIKSILQKNCPSLEDCEAVYSILNKYI